MSLPLRAQREALEELWQQGLGGHELLQRHTALVDAYLAEQFRGADAVRDSRGQLAIIALGGYGRKELYPFSDIDLLLLHDRRASKSMQAISETLLYPLWDAGFDVGHSVRGVKDAVAFADEDFIFQVSLLDARLVVGSEQLFAALMERYRKKIFDRRRHEFVQTMEQYRLERREKYGSHAYLLEPHIKEGKGGMRDIQAMLWVARGVFGLHGLAEMENSGMLDRDDRLAFEQSWDMLARIRNRLHYIRRRKDDQLVFEFQEEMADAFGYHDQGGVLGVEHFMRDVYSHLQTIAVVTDLFFEHVHEVLGLTAKGVQEERELERSIVARQGTVRLVRTEDLLERPYLLMRLFLLSGRTGLPLHHMTRKVVSQHLELVDDRFRSSKRVARVFVEVLMESAQPLPVLEAMLATGLLFRYIPEFAGVESLAQHDLYHIYTVDRHSAQTVAELAKLRESMPELFAELKSPHLLYLAALLHDIGKGRRKDHSALGAEMIGTVGKRLGLSQQERLSLAFLVRHHLYLPENALRRDLDDQEFIRQAAEMLGDEERLTMLYLLTMADSKATGPSAWSTWKATLLGDFYLKVKSCLAVNCIYDTTRPTVQDQGVIWMREQVQERLKGLVPPRMNVDALPSDYLLNFTPERILFHLHVHREQEARLQQQVLLFPESGSEVWPLLLMTRDRPGLLAKFCGVLSLYNLLVRSAQIFTWPDGTVVDVINVAPSTTREFDEMDWQGLQSDLNRAVNYRLDLGAKLRSKQQVLGLGPKRQVQQLIRKVVIDNQTSQQYTILELYGGDSPTILYHLTQVIADFGLDIHRARIATEVEQLIDVFYVSTQTGDKLTDAATKERISRTLMRIVGAEEVDIETSNGDAITPEGSTFRQPPGFPSIHKFGSEL